jgi:hypothetical protein
VVQFEKFKQVLHQTTAMKNTMIAFLTNEQVPERLRMTIRDLKERQKHERIAKRDGQLVILGTFFLSALACLIALLVYFF